MPSHRLFEGGNQAAQCSPWLLPEMNWMEAAVDGRCKNTTMDWMQNDAQAASMQSPCCGCLQGSLCKTRVAIILAHMDELVTRANARRAAGMGLWQRQANKAWQGKATAERAAVAQTGRHVKLAGLWSRSGGLWRECGGAGRFEGGLGPTLQSPSQPIAFACLCPYPLP